MEYIHEKSVAEAPLGRALFLIWGSYEVREDHLTHLKLVQKEFPEPAEYLCFSQVERALKLGDIMVYPWQEGIKKFFQPDNDLILI